MSNESRNVSNGRPTNPKLNTAGYFCAVNFVDFRLTKNNFKNFLFSFALYEWDIILRRPKRTSKTLSVYTFVHNSNAQTVR